MRNALWFISIGFVFFALGLASAQTSAISPPAPVPTSHTIFCKYDGALWDAFTDEGHFACSEPLSYGLACFVGDSAPTIARINNLEVSWDEEWLEEAQELGVDSITYVWVDGPNDLREDLRIDRCSPEFFQ